LLLLLRSFHFLPFIEHAITDCTGRQDQLLALPVPSNIAAKCRFSSGVTRLLSGPGPRPSASHRLEKIEQQGQEMLGRATRKAQKYDDQQ